MRELTSIHQQLAAPPPKAKAEQKAKHKGATPAKDGAKTKTKAGPKQ